MRAVFFWLAFCCALCLLALICCFWSGLAVVSLQDFRRCFRGGCVAWLGSGPLAGVRIWAHLPLRQRRPGTPAQWQPRIVPPPLHTPHPPPVAQGLSVRTLRCFSQDSGDVRGRRPHSRLPARWQTGTVLTKGSQRTGPSARERGPENAHVATVLARGQQEKRSELSQQAGARQCTAQPPTPEPPTVPRETPTRRPARQPVRLRDVCPSSPSTPPPASRQTTTRW